MKAWRCGLIPRALWGFLALGELGCLHPSDPGHLVPPTADQDQALPQLAVEVAGQTRVLHLETFGDPSLPALFVLHGSYSDYRGLLALQALSTRYFMVFWDQRGCGLSERISEDEFTLDSAVEEVAVLKARFSPDRPITLLGLSWGGGLASLYTARHPEQIQKLVLLEPMPLTGALMRAHLGELIEFRYGNPGWNELVRMNELLAPDSHEALDFRAFLQLHTGMAQYFCDPSNPPPWPVWRVGGYIEYVRQKRLGGADPDYDFTAGLAGYGGRTLILGGQCGGLGYAFQRDHHQPFFPEVRVAEIQEAGHRMVVERPEAVLEVLRGFLTGFENEGGAS